jgi:hypothetical protein
LFRTKRKKTEAAVTKTSVSLDLSSISSWKVLVGATGIDSGVLKLLISLTTP